MGLLNEDEVPVLQLRCVEDVKMGLLGFVKVYLHDVELSARGIFMIMHLRRKRGGLVCDICWTSEGGGGGRA